MLFSYRAMLAQAPSLPQAAAAPLRQAAFRAVSYDVSVSLSPADQTISGRAIVEFQSREPSSTVECELHPNLKITAVRDSAGKPLQFDRDNARPLRVRVLLSDPVATGQSTKITFDYAGPLANDENSPVTGVRMAWIGKDGAYLLLPARWFPLTDYPSNRYTGVFRVEVPNTFVVVGTGTSGPPTTPAPLASISSDAPAAPAPGGPDPDAPVLARSAARKGAAPAPKAAPARKAPPAAAPPPSPVPVRALQPAADSTPRHVYTFHVDRPSAAGTFVAGALQMFPVRAEGIDISVYAPPSASATAQPQGEAVAHTEGIFADRFGPLPDPSLTLAQLPDGSLASYAAPGLLLVSQRQWLGTPNVRQLAGLVASQWWGNQVMAASPADVWLTTGLSRYSEALYVEQTAGTAGMNQALEDFAIGSLMFDSAAPIAQAAQLEPFTPNYDSVVRDKGAMVFHMLRGQMGDMPFFSLLHDFLTQYSGKTASLGDFEALAQAHVQAAAPPAQPAGFVLRGDSDAQAAAKAPTASEALNLRPFFAQWINSTGVPEFSVTYTVYRVKSGFKLIGKVKQNLDFFRMPVEMEIQTEGNPEFKTILVTGNETPFDVDVFGRPKANGITLDPHNFLLKSSAKLRVRGVIARGEALAEVGRYYDAVQQYNQALEIDKNNPLATFRTGEAFFYQKNYSAAANAFRDAVEGDLDLNLKWVEVWSHIYLGKIYDISGDRARAVNEYSKAEQTNDNTGGAQDEVKKYIAQAYSDDQPGGAAAPAAGAAPASAAPSAAPATPDRPVLQHRE